MATDEANLDEVFELAKRLRASDQARLIAHLARSIEQVLKGSEIVNSASHLPAQELPSDVEPVFSAIGINELQVTMRLADYFKDGNYQRALEQYRVVQSSKWPLTERLILYGYAKVVFTSQNSEQQKRLAFQKIYNWLVSYWQVNRRVPLNWNATTLLSTLIENCNACPRSNVSLKTLSANADGQEQVKHCLDRLKNLKSTNDYPFVAVSKFLHFYNPNLFPVYDETVIWRKVCYGTFKNDYQRFCHHKGFREKERTAQFNLNYTLWASELVSQADQGFMGYFADWFGAQVQGRPDPYNVLSEVEQYYAAAFEFTAIGAAYLEHP